MSFCRMSKGTSLIKRVRYSSCRICLVSVLIAAFVFAIAYAAFGIGDAPADAFETDPWTYTGNLWKSVLFLAVTGIAMIITGMAIQNRYNDEL